MCNCRSFSIVVNENVRSTQPDKCQCFGNSGCDLRRSTQRGRTAIVEFNLGSSQPAKSCLRLSQRRLATVCSTTRTTLSPTTYTCSRTRQVSGLRVFVRGSGPYLGQGRLGSGVPAKKGPHQMEHRDAGAPPKNKFIPKYHAQGPPPPPPPPPPPVLNPALSGITVKLVCYGTAVACHVDIIM